MTETDPLGPTYKGDKNEQVTVTVEEQNTVHSVNYVLDGVKHTLVKGTPIVFNLKTDGHATVLEFSFRFSNPTGGAYVVKVKNVDGFPNKERTLRWEQEGSLPVVIDYTFKTQ